MTDDQANLILEHLRRIRGGIAGLKSDVLEARQRLGLIEEAYANLSRRLDRQGDKLDLILKRLDLVET